MKEHLRLNQGVWFKGKPCKINGIKTLTYQTTTTRSVDSKILYVDLEDVGRGKIHYDIDPLQLQFEAPESEEESAIRKAKEALDGSAAAHSSGAWSILSNHVAELELRIQDLIEALEG